MHSSDHNRLNDISHEHEYTHDHDHEQISTHSEHDCHAHTHADNHEHEYEHEHDHEHNHAHGAGGHHHHVPTHFGKAFAIGITLNLTYIIAEIIWGITAHSLALIADAGHNLSDVFALGSAWVAAYLSQKQPSANFTYGYRRTSILASLTNAIILLVVTGGIIWEALERFLSPAPVAGWTVIIVALGGVLVNGITALMFHSGHKEDLNIKGAFLHMAYDALLSLSVALTGIVILFTHWNVLDPIISLIVSAVIIMGTWSLLKDSIILAIDGVPTSINPLDVEGYLRSQPDVMDIHDLHIWAMSTTETALTVHLVSNNTLQTGFTLNQLAKSLKQRFRIDHATFQVEPQDKAPFCLLAGHETV